MIRQNELYAQTLPLEAGHFTDVGYRFRTNIFDHTDFVYPETPAAWKRFFDFKFFNQDTFKVDKKQNLLAEIYFRLEVDQMSHTRKVDDIYVYLEKIGGVPEVLKQIASILVGSYCFFYSQMVNIAIIYKVNPTKK